MKFLMTLMIIILSIIIFIMGNIITNYKNERDCVAGITSGCNQNSSYDDPIQTPANLKKKIKDEYAAIDAKNKPKPIILESEVICKDGYKWLREGTKETQLGNVNNWDELIPIKCEE